jgi:DivIVA domain-containing protein
MNRLTPLEIQRATFPRRLRGLDRGAVFELLSQIAEQVEEEARLRGELRAQLAQLTQEVEQHRQRAEAINEAMVSAQRAAEATIARAEQDAQRMLAEAQALADKLVDEAGQRAENIEILISQLRGQRRLARGDLKRLTGLIEGLVRDDEATEQREPEVPSVAVLRHRQRESKGER